MLVAAEDDQRVEAVLVRAIRVRQAVVHRMLAREERHDAGPRHIDPEVDQQMAEVVLLLQSDRAVGQEDMACRRGSGS